MYAELLNVTEHTLLLQHSELHM